MEIKCTPQEVKELIQKETPVAGTTDVKITLDGKKIAKNLATRGKALKDLETSQNLN